MHIESALLSLPLAASAWAASAGSASLLRRPPSDQTPPVKKIALFSALVFAAQMANVAIPGTGSSGHFVGGVLLALALGPFYGLLAMAAVLAVQSLFFFDGGLLAYGANVLNMGVIPATLVAWALKRGLPQAKAPRLAAIAGLSLAGILLGAFSTTALAAASGPARLGFTAMAAYMLPIHAVIGLGEAALSVLLLEALGQTRAEAGRQSAWKPALALVAAAALGLSALASTQPDGLNWALAHLRFQAAPNGHVAVLFERVQTATAVLKGIPAPLAGLLGSLLSAALAAAAGKALLRQR